VACHCCECNVLIFELQFGLQILPVFLVGLLATVISVTYFCIRKCHRKGNLFVDFNFSLIKNIHWCSSFRSTTQVRGGGHTVQETRQSVVLWAKDVT
jgi:hypothetical protein